MSDDGLLDVDQLRAMYTARGLDPARADQLHTALRFYGGGKDPSRRGRRRPPRPRAPQHPPPRHEEEP